MNIITKIQNFGIEIVGRGRYMADHNADNWQSIGSGD